MIELDNQTDLKIPLELLERIVSKFTTQIVELLIVSKEQMHAINLEQRGIDAATDVLSFGYESSAHTPYGSIVISDWHVRDVASQMGHSTDDELSLLFIHGMLHLSGMDHECDDGAMQEAETRLVVEFGLPKSLIERSEEL